MNHHRLHGDQPGTHTKSYPENKRPPASRQGKTAKEPYENRPDWAIGYRTDHNCWYGVVRLSLTGELYGLFISRYQDRQDDLGHYSLRVTPKSGPRSKPSIVQLLPAPKPGRFRGILFVEGQKYRVWLGVQGPYLRLFFEERRAQ